MNKKAFLKEYKVLCLKYDMYITEGLPPFGVHQMHVRSKPSNHSNADWKYWIDEHLEELVRNCIL